MYSFDGLYDAADAQMEPVCVGELGAGALVGELGKESPDWREEMLMEG